MIFKDMEEEKVDQNREEFGADVEVVITSFNQGSMILEAVESVCAQTFPPQKIIIIDDGSTDESSIRVLKEIEERSDLPIPVMIHYRENGGVSAARNTGIRKAQASMVLVLDGDDRLEPEYVENVSGLLYDNPSMVAASSWLHTFGVLDSIVCPAGGKISAFLSRNCCPATHMLRRDIFERCGGYDESMRSGFEDWDFFLSMLETSPEAWIGIVDKPLIQYRTAPASSNIKSMNKRLELMRFMIEKHADSFQEHIIDALLGIEAISNARLYNWENEMVHAITKRQELSQSSKDFLKSPTYGDGGMASAVRIASIGQDHKGAEGVKIIAETDRLILRRYRTEDLQDLFEYLSDPEVVKYEPYKPMTEEETREDLKWRIDTDEMIAVELKGSHKMIGNVYMGRRDCEAMEMGYVFNRKFWGQGYAAESCKALMEQMFSKGIHRIYAECDPNNTSSWKLLETLGFKREAHFAKNVYFWKDEAEKALWKDTYVYAKLNESI